MPEQPNHTFVTGLLMSLASRTHAETVVLTARLRERCWPGGDDRTDALAREWLKRRGLTVHNPETVDCSCGSGRCRVCN